MKKKIEINTDNKLNEDMKTKIYIDDLEKRLEANLRDLNDLKFFIHSSANNNDSKNNNDSNNNKNNENINETIKNDNISDNRNDQINVMEEFKEKEENNFKN